MGRKRPEKGGRRGGGGGRTSSSGDQRRSDAAHNRSGAGAEHQGPARLLLTRLVRDDVIWDVYIAATVQSGGRNVTELHFERALEPYGRLRHARPVEGPLLDALYSGEPVSRASLAEELERALREAEPNDEEAAAPAAELTDPAGDLADPAAIDAADRE